MRVIGLIMVLILVFLCSRFRSPSGELIAMLHYILLNYMCFTEIFHRWGIWPYADRHCICTWELHQNLGLWFARVKLSYSSPHSPLPPPPSPPTHTHTPNSGPTHRSKPLLLLQLCSYSLFICVFLCGNSSVLIVPHCSFWCLGRVACFVIVTFPVNVHLYCFIYQQIRFSSITTAQTSQRATKKQTWL